MIDAKEDKPERTTDRRHLPSVSSVAGTHFDFEVAQLWHALRVGPLFGLSTESIVVCASAISIAEISSNKWEEVM